MIEETLRRKLGLPITKEIVYFPSRRNESIEIVTDIDIANAFDSFYVLLITTEIDRRVLIHSSYLKEMQNPNFTKEMAKQEAIECYKHWFIW